MKKKILIINTIGLYFEGISTVIYNYVSSMDRSDFEIDFLTFAPVDTRIRERFEKLGNIVVVPNRKADVKGYVKALNRILRAGYDVIHVHGNSGTMVIEAFLARLHRVTRILVHCHNTKCSHPLLNKFLTPVMKVLATDLIACSRASGDWLYGKSKYLVLNNAIDIQKYEFDPTAREEVRNAFQIGDAMLIGHIGAFLEAKNQPYLVDVFADFHRRYPNSKLMLVSDGPKLEDVKRQVELLELKDSVIFTGRRPDVQRLYQAMDVFVMPSRWEGLGLVLLESQASGLPVLASDRITREASCTDRICFLSIDQAPAVWADKLMELTDEKIDRIDGIAQQLRRHGFDIQTEAAKLRSIYAYEG